MVRPSLIGFSDESRSAGGIAPYAGSSIPGPLGIDSQGPDRWIEHDGRKRARSGDAPPLRLTFTLGFYTYRLRRVHEWHQADEMPVMPYRAALIVEQAIVEHQDNSELVQQLQTSLAQLAGLHSDGTVLLWRVEPYEGRAVTPAPEAKPARRPPPPSPMPPAVKEPVVGPDQAAALKDAAANGVPFCEECARAAAAQAGAAPAA
jgi:hypothetical protein